MIDEVSSRLKTKGVHDYRGICHYRSKENVYVSRKKTQKVSLIKYSDTI